MSRVGGWAVVVWLLGVSGAGALLGQPETEGFDVRLIGPPGSEGQSLRRALVEDLDRTPRRHGLIAVAGADLDDRLDGRDTLALFEIRWADRATRPTVKLAQGWEGLSPGWLVHVMLRAGATVEVPVEVTDARSSWLAQLVERSTRHNRSSVADHALEQGIPSLIVDLPLGDESGERLLAAAVRRLDGLDGYPVFEDEFLVVGGRVLLRRDLYWLGLVAWLGLFWRGRRRPGREFRWLLLAAWLVAPAYATVLLLLPSLVAAWLPESRWAAAAATLPSLVFGARLAYAIAGPPSLVVSAIPALLVTLALGAFVWHHVLDARMPGLFGSDRRASTTGL